MYRFAYLPLVCLLCGCVKYHSDPLDPPRLEQSYYSRSLADPGLRAFVQENSVAKPSAWPPAELNLATLTLIALYYSPELDLARAHLQTAEAQVITAGGRPNPFVSFGAGYTNSPESPVVAHFDPSLTLITAGKRGYQILAAQKRAASAYLEISEAEWHVHSNVRNAWLNYLAARRSLDLLNREQKVRAASVHIVTARLAVGEASRPDVEAERAGLAEAEVATRAAEGVAAQNLASLAAVAGVPVSAIENARFADPPAPPTEASLALGPLQRTGLLNRIDIRRSLLDYEAAEAALHLEIARQYPDIDVSPGYSFDEGHHKFTFGPGFPVPMLNRNRGPIAEAEGRRAEAKAQFIVLQAQAIGEMEKALAAYRTARAELASAQDRLRTLQQTREQGVLRRVEVGEADQLGLAGARLQSNLAGQIVLDAWRKSEAALGALEDAVQRPLEAGLPALPISAPQPKGTDKR